MDGQGYSNSGAVRGVAGSEPVSFDALAYVAALDTEAALVVLAEKLSVAVGETRDACQRLATIPFDSSYKFMATLRRLPYEGEQRIVALVKGAPDVIPRPVRWSEVARRARAAGARARRSRHSRGRRRPGPRGSDGLRL